jgi:hypothetical protein
MSSIDCIGDIHHQMKVPMIDDLEVPQHGPQHRRETANADRW